MRIIPYHFAVRFVNAKRVRRPVAPVFYLAAGVGAGAGVPAGAPGAWGATGDGGSGAAGI